MARKSAIFSTLLVLMVAACGGTNAPAPNDAPNGPGTNIAEKPEGKCAPKPRDERPELPSPFALPNLEKFEGRIMIPANALVIDAPEDISDGPAYKIGDDMLTLDQLRKRLDEFSKRTDNGLPGMRDDVSENPVAIRFKPGARSMVLFECGQACSGSMLRNFIFEVPSDGAEPLRIGMRLPAPADMPIPPEPEFIPEHEVEFPPDEGMQPTEEGKPERKPKEVPEFTYKGPLTLMVLNDRDKGTYGFRTDYEETKVRHDATAFAIKSLVNAKGQVVMKEYSRLRRVIAETVLERAWKLTDNPRYGWPESLGIVVSEARGKRTSYDVIVAIMALDALQLLNETGRMKEKLLVMLKQGG